jgi:hypothetical protein
MDNALREYYLKRRVEWPPEQRAHEAGRATRLPDGRAWHLVDRYMELSAPIGTGAGLIYQGKLARIYLLTLAYATVAYDQPALILSADRLAWVGELTDQVAVDVALVEVDRAARQLLDHREQAYPRIERMLVAKPASVPQRALEGLAGKWKALHQPFYDGEGYPHVILPWRAARQTLDALLVEGTGAFAPGSRVRLLAAAGEHANKSATIFEATWAWDAEDETRSLPVGYLVHPDRTIADVDVPVAGVEVLLEQKQD